MLFIWFPAGPITNTQPEVTSNKKSHGTLEGRMKHGIGKESWAGRLIQVKDTTEDWRSLIVYDRKRLAYISWI